MRSNYEPQGGGEGGGAAGIIVTIIVIIIFCFFCFWCMSALNSGRFGDEVGYEEHHTTVRPRAPKVAPAQGRKSVVACEQVQEVKRRCTRLRSRIPEGGRGELAGHRGRGRGRQRGRGAES